MSRTSTSRPIPWFCPSCLKTGADAPKDDLCAHCGDRVVAQGYCPVCEDFQPREAGALCPKHDLPLEDEAPAPAWSRATGPWVMVARYTDALACQAPRIRLEAEGIPTVVDGERMGSKSMYHVATGGVQLSVPASLESEARVILSQTWSQDAVELGIEDDDWDDLDEDGLGAGGSGEAPPVAFLFSPLLALGLVILGVVLVVGLSALLGLLAGE